MDKPNSKDKPEITDVMDREEQFLTRIVLKLMRAGLLVGGAAASRTRTVVGVAVGLLMTFLSNFLSNVNERLNDSTLNRGNNSIVQVILQEIVLTGTTCWNTIASLLRRALAFLQGLHDFISSGSSRFNNFEGFGHDHRRLN